MFQVLYSPGAAKALKKIPKEAAKRIVKSIDTLSEVDDPRRYIKKLKDHLKFLSILFELETTELF